MKELEKKKSEWDEKEEADASGVDFSTLKTMNLGDGFITSFFERKDQLWNQEYHIIQP